jgi:HlyD family secretion protein
MRLVKHLRTIIVALVVAAVVVVAMWPEALTVDVVTTSAGAMEVTLDEDGETRVRQRFVISAPVAGRLSRIELEPGDRVARNMIVARLAPAPAALIDPRTRSELNAAVETARAQIGQAQAERERAAAALERAKSTDARQRALFEAGAVPRDAVEAAETARRTAEEAARAADFAVQGAEFQLKQALARLQAPRAGDADVDIRSPIDGTLLKRFHESAAVVAAGEPLVEIGDTSQLEIVADLLSTDAVRVAPGADVRIEQWGGGQALHGRVRRVEPSGFMKVSALGVEEQRVNVIIDFVDPAAGRALGDGYRVEVRIVIWRGDEVLKVPTGSLFRSQDAWAVFVVDGDRVRLQTVEIGQRNQADAQVVSGLSAGQALVLHPPDTLVDGARVTVRGQ